MNRPLIGVTNAGVGALHLSEAYFEALWDAGTSPVLLPNRVDWVRTEAYADTFAGFLFTGGGDVYARYLEAKNRFEKLVPKWELYYEHMLVNHMFFSEFPLQDRPESFHDEYAALCVIYTLLRFLCIGWLAQHYTENAFTDICAAAFRLIDHTDFEHYALYLLKKTGMNGGDSLDEWIVL